jgi:hypothetical protein
MFEWLKTSTGAYNLRLIVAIIAWLITGAGIFAGFHLNKLRSKEAEAKAQLLRSAIPPRVISAMQRDTVLEVLLDSKNVSPKIPIKVLVLDLDHETKAFAESLRRLLDEAGYGKPGEGVLKFSHLRIHPADDSYERKLPDIIAIFSTDTGEVPPPTLPGFGSVMMMNPTALSISRGDKSHPRVFRYTDNPNDILWGVSVVLKFVGINCQHISGHKILQPGEIGFFVPKQVNSSAYK